MSPILDENNEVIQIIGIARDMTDTVKAQVELQQNEQMYRTIAQNVDIPIYRYAKDFKRLYVNPAVEKIAGKSAAELIGKSPFEERIVSHDQDEALQRSIQKVFTTKQQDSVELLFILPDGTKKYFMHNHIPEFTEDGSVGSVLAIGHDVTLQKKLLKKRKSLER